jgi:hypothetical protein
VWFEGTAHIADALETQDQPGDTAQAASYLADIAYAQVNGPNADGLGIMASSQDALADCGGGYVYASLHTGTTAWYILAGEGIDPPIRNTHLRPAGLSHRRRRWVRASPRELEGQVFVREAYRGKHCGSACRNLSGGLRPSPGAGNSISSLLQCSVMVRQCPVFGLLARRGQPRREGPAIARKAVPADHPAVHAAATSRSDVR